MFSKSSSCSHVLIAPPLPLHDSMLEDSDGFKHKLINIRQTIFPLSLLPHTPSRMSYLEIGNRLNLIHKRSNYAVSFSRLGVVSSAEIRVISSCAAGSTPTYPTTIYSLSVLSKSLSFSERSPHYCCHLSYFCCNLLLLKTKSPNSFHSQCYFSKVAGLCTSHHTGCNLPLTNVDINAGRSFASGETSDKNIFHCKR